MHDSIMGNLVTQMITNAKGLQMCRDHEITEVLETYCSIGGKKKQWLVFFFLCWFWVILGILNLPILGEWKNA